jgi:DNA-binding NtrC family response regulator
MAHEWPGNIRELENVIEHAVVLADGPAVTIDDLPAEVRQPGRRRFRSRVATPAGARASAGPVVSGATASPPGKLAHARKSDTLKSSGPNRDSDDLDEEWNAEFLAFERQRLQDALDEAGGNKSVAARLLGMPRSTFFSKLKKHGIL